jgi:5'(3')-deoxyribonucleotidase
MDGTIEDLSSTWVRWLNKRYNLNVKTGDIKEWDMQIAFPTLTKDEIYAPLSEPDFWLDVEAFKEADIYLPKLIEEGYNIYIVTTTHPKIVGMKFKNCLFRLFPCIDRHKTIITCNKQMIKMDLLIDDGTHNIEGDYLGLLVDAPYNHYYDATLTPKVMRVINWREIYDIIHKMTESG